MSFSEQILLDYQASFCENIGKYRGTFLHHTAVFVRGLANAGRSLKMSDGTKNQITLLLTDWSRGDSSALERLMPLVYEELRQRANRYMRNQPSGHTFQTTELIHEAYLKIAKIEDQTWENRAHFFAVASQAMRHILVDYARAKQSQKRGAWQERVTFSENAPIFSERSDKLIALDDALKTLATLDERKAAVVEMKFFGGLTNEEICQVLNVSEKTVMRDWHFARAWLLKEIAGEDLKEK